MLLLEFGFAESPFALKVIFLMYGLKLPNWLGNRLRSQDVESPENVGDRASSVKANLLN